MDSQISIIDAHHHLWNLRRCYYPWLMTKGVKRFFGNPAPIQKNYLVEDFFDDIGSLPVVASVHVQVGVEEDQAVEETRWLQSVADAKTSNGFPQGIIAFCNLAETDAMEKIEQHRQFANLRGIRQIVGRSPDEDAVTGTNKLLENPVWKKNLSSLVDYDLSFDLQLIPSQLRQMRQILNDMPGLKVALCHSGSPFNQGKEGLAYWKTGLKKLAELPNVYCKISGYGMFDHHWTTDSIRQLVLHVIEYFTPSRCMFGSNFPVDKLYAGYRDTWCAYEEITSGFSASERQLLFNETARRFYSIVHQDLSKPVK